MGLRDFLELLGFGQYFLLPLLTCGILLAWHHTRADAWSMRGGVLSTMLIESILFALILYAAAHLQRAVFSQITLNVSNQAPQSHMAGTIGRLIGYCGAGIYEELLFRLMLLPSAAAVLRCCGIGWRRSLVWAIVITSLMFSAAHYQVFTSGGYAFDWYSFSFRFMAGVFFPSSLCCAALALRPEHMRCTTCWSNWSSIGAGTAADREAAGDASVG